MIMVKKERMAVMREGTFHRRFSTFAEGIDSLMEVSDSAYQALEAGRVAVSNLYTGEPTLHDYGERAVPECPERVATWLACNAWHPLAGGPLNLWVGKDRLSYTTTGGLSFSWWRIEGGQWLFQLTHPKGEAIPEESSLRASALKHGWHPGEDRYAGSFDEGALP